MQGIVLVDGGAADLASVRQTLEATGHTVEGVRTPEEAVALARSQALLRAHRTESLAAIAGGIAHDLNNVLASSLMAIDLLAGSAAQLPAGILGALEESVRRATGLVRQLLWFARGLESDGARFQPKHLMTELQKLLSALLPAGTDLETSYPADLWFLSADPLQVYELLLGLLRAGWSALPPGGGSLTLAAENVIVDDTFARMLPGVRHGSYIAFAVSPGPPQELPEGLAALLAALGGVAAPPDARSGLRAYLPAARPAGESADPRPKAARGEGELVLLAEADPVLRELLAAALEKGGYRPLVAADGSEAVALFSAHAGEAAAVLAARDLAWLDGPATLHAVAHLRPGVPTLLLEDGLPAGAPPSALPVLRKPFSGAQLLQALSERLRGG
jgi:CheY-like chemotaxis protein